MRQPISPEVPGLNLLSGIISSLPTHHVCQSPLMEEAAAEEAIETRSPRTSNDDIDTAATEVLLQQYRGSDTPEVMKEVLPTKETRKGSCSSAALGARVTPSAHSTRISRRGRVPGGLTATSCHALFKNARCPARN